VSADDATSSEFWPCHRFFLMQRRTLHMHDSLLYAGTNDNPELTALWYGGSSICSDGLTTSGLAAPEKIPHSRVFKFRTSGWREGPEFWINVLSGQVLQEARGQCSMKLEVLTPSRNRKRSVRLVQDCEDSTSCCRLSTHPKP
jgi:hypothetical protein